MTEHSLYITILGGLLFKNMIEFADNISKSVHVEFLRFQRLPFENAAVKEQDMWRVLFFIVWITFVAEVGGRDFWACALKCSTRHWLKPERSSIHSEVDVRVYEVHWMQHGAVPSSETQTDSRGKEHRHLPARVKRGSPSEISSPNRIFTCVLLSVVINFSLWFPVST